MKKQIFLFLFIFAVLFILFQYVNSRRAYADTGRRIEQLSKDNERMLEENRQLKDSLKQTLIKLSDYDYFSLEHDTQAQEYFYNLDIEDVTKYVSDKLIETNILSKGDNKLIPYVGTYGTMRINKIQVVNHRWILCDFTDGKNWGQLVVEYFINDNLTVDFSTVAHVLYPKN